MKSSNSNLPQLLKAIRKHQKLGQTQVAKVLNLEQSSYSRVESGSQKLTAEQWFLFCELTGTPPDAAFLGCIDRLRPVGLPDPDGFDLPNRYAVERGSAVRTILPLVDFARTQWGKKKWADYLHYVKMKPDFFFYLDNVINVNFELDLAKELIKSTGLNHKILSEALVPVCSPSFQGQLRFQYGNLPDPGERLKTIVANQKYYGTNFTYSIEEPSKKGMYLTATPSGHLEDIAYRNDPSLHDFLCRYRKAFLKRYAEGPGNENRVQIKELACHFKEGPQCTYQVSYTN